MHVVSYQSSTAGEKNERAMPRIADRPSRPIQPELGSYVAYLFV